MEWIKCDHRDVLQVGEYVLKYQYFNCIMTTIFKVYPNDISREINEPKVIAYCKLPYFNL